jgi:adenylate cyclase class 2
MVTEYIETEVKYWVESLDAVRERLGELGAKQIGDRVLETNIRLDRPDRSLGAAGQALRLRHSRHAVQAPSTSVLTYKARLAEPTGETALVKALLEIEVEVADFERMQAILERLGFETVFIYEKYRETFRLGDAEVMLDELPYGCFVEVEGEVSAIDRVAEQLGLLQAQRVPGTYLSLFEDLRRRRRLPLRDLTFANFATFRETPLTAQDLGLSLPALHAAGGRSDER